MTAHRLLGLAAGIVLAASPAMAASLSTAPGTGTSGPMSGSSQTASGMHPGALQRGETTGTSQAGTYAANANQDSGKGGSGSSSNSGSSGSAAGGAGQE